MIKYYCDVCGKEITGWHHEMAASLQNPYRGRNEKNTPLHFHEECMRKMLDYLSKGEAQKDDG